MRRAIGPRWTISIALAWVTACAGNSEASHGAPSLDPTGEIDRAIGSCHERLRRDPTLYPALAELGAAHLERAKLTHTVDDLALAQQALTESLRLQNNFEALRISAALLNFQHRFREALRYAQDAHQTLPSDGFSLSLLIESLVGVGDVDAARTLLSSAGEMRSEFHRQSCLARLADADLDWEAAVAAYGAAADEARRQGVPKLEAWACVAAAGIRLDHGDAELALPWLDRAQAATPQNPAILVHRAELALARGESESALSCYEAALRLADDPMTRLSALRIARGPSLLSRARDHFEAAEPRLRASAEAGYEYTWPALAELYFLDGRQMDEARRWLDQSKQSSNASGHDAETILRLKAALGGGI